MKKPKLVLEPGLTTVALLDLKKDLPERVWCRVFFDWMDRVANTKWIDWYYCPPSLAAPTNISERTQLQDRCREQGLHGITGSFKDINPTSALLATELVISTG